MLIPEEETPQEEGLDGRAMAEDCHKCTPGRASLC